MALNLSRWLAVDQDGEEWIYDILPERKHNAWGIDRYMNNAMFIPQGTIEKIIGRALTWEDEPIEIK